MKIISNGETFSIYSDNLHTYNELPPLAYIVRFEKMKGFFLERFPNIEVSEKIYGAHISKVEKVLRSFEKFQRNLGVILSGDKGIGKSLFAKLLSVEAVKAGIPLIIVDKYYPGIAAYLQSIEQKVMVLFDEFDKTYGEIKEMDGCASPQTELLTLFDGISTGKKIFVITCNELSKLNDYLVNRPGRFHYHFRFGYPNAGEVEEYLKDKLPEEMYGEIPQITDFSRKVNLNYDSLRAIAFEISCGSKFSEAIEDLNIINFNEYMKYNLVLRFTNGETLSAKNVGINMFDDEELIYRYWLSDLSSHEPVRVDFDVSNCTFSTETGCYLLKPGEFKLCFDEEEEDEEVVKKYRSLTPEILMIRRRPAKSLRYAV